MLGSRYIFYSGLRKIGWLRYVWDMIVGNGIVFRIFKKIIFRFQGDTEGKRKRGFIKNDMSGYDNFIGGKFKTVVITVVGWVVKEYVRSGARG